MHTIMEQQPKIKYMDATTSLYQKAKDRFTKQYGPVDKIDELYIDKNGQCFGGQGRNHCKD
jgi:hypothetical protein